MHAIVVAVLVLASHLAYSSGPQYSNVISVFHESRCNSAAVQIENFPTDIQNSTEVKFCEAAISLSKCLTVKNKTHIRVSGNTTITCLKSGGLIFDYVDDLTIHGISVVNCGIVYHGTTDIASVFLLNCMNVNIGNINITNSTDIDLYMVNLKDGKVTEGFFSKYNNDHSLTPHSRVHVKFDNDMTKHSTGNSVTFVNSTFGYRNSQTESKRACSTKAKKESEVGGGLIVTLGQSNLSLTIENCTFQNLYTSTEGALYIRVSENAHGNTIAINNSHFVNNTCYKCGGAGVRVDFKHKSSDAPFPGNTILLFNSSFTGNCAKYGGGMLINSRKSRNSKFEYDIIESRSCSWTRNTARYGSAIDTIAGNTEPTLGELLLKTILINCTFANNRIEALRFGKGKVTVFGQGTVSVIDFHISFVGDTLFTENVGTPLYLSSSYADFSANSNTTFIRNQGLNGGAMTILGTSALRAKGGSIFTFTENEAYFKGGAIYYNNIDGHIYLTAHNCFIQYNHGEGNDSANDVEDKPQYIFTNNKAGTAFGNNDSLGKSIYASTLYQCEKYCGSNSSMNCVGRFQYQNTCRNFELATSEWNMQISEYTPLLHIIPGKETELPVQTTDELQQTLNAVYKVTLWHNSTTDIKPSILPAYRYIHNRKVVLQAEPSDEILKLALTTVHNREIRLTLSVIIVPCPPGYILHENSLCRCSADLDVKFHFQGVLGCNSTSFQAQLQSGFWVGYSTESYRTLIGSICPRGFCSNATAKNIPLPGEFNVTVLDYLLCGDSRTGRLCARCRGNRSVHYHSNSYRCKGNQVCQVGWLLYSLSELAPVTLIFLTVITFNIQLTSGAILGLILYYQLLDTMLITANNIIKLPEGTYWIYKFHRLFAQMFNLDFFVYENLSFCLWRGATTLDIIAFKYCTVVCALLMVFVTIIIIKTCNYTYCCTKLRRATRRKRQVTNSVIHGISGFFILCYSECTRVSLLLLRPIQFEDPYNILNNTKHVLYDGEMEYLGAAHMKYALPALFFLSTIVFVPPVLLLAYPLCYRVFTLLRIEESKCSRIMCMLIPLEKLKPFFDSFQGSFKDRHRYMSGVYFIYRLIAVCLAVFTTYNMTLFYTLLEVLLLSMISILAYCQPHKLNKHNRQDLFVFTTLAVVNALTFYNFMKSVDFVDQQHTVNVATSLQIVFLSIPTLYAAIRGALFMLCITRRWCEETSEEDTETELLERDIGDDDDMDQALHSPHYKRMSHV